MTAHVAARGGDNSTVTVEAGGSAAPRRIPTVVGMDTRPPALATALKLGRSLLTTVIIPLGLFYGLRAVGVDQWWALAIGGLVPLLSVGHQLVTTGRIDRLGIFVVFAMVVGTVVSLIQGDPRALLARESWGTAVIGIGILWSLRGNTPPILFGVAKPFLGPDVAASWDLRWADDPRFRHGIRVVTALWGVAFVLDSVLRVIMAYALPIDVVPVLSVALIVVTLALANLLGKAYARRAGLRLVPRG